MLSARLRAAGCPVRVVALALVCGALGMPSVHAQEWARFRGPNGTGVSEAATIPAQWTEADYNFKVQLPGMGHSSPVIWGRKLFLTSASEENNERYVICLDSEDGSTIWQRTFPFEPHQRHKMNSFASNTPAVDADHVYVAWTEPEHYLLMALDHEGNEKWQVDLGPFTSQHSGGTSPIVVGDMVVIGNEQDGPSFLRAVNRKTGETVWQTPRRTVDQGTSYATPCVRELADGSYELIFNSEAHGISGLDPATGKTRWELAVFDKRTVSSPLLAGGLVFGTCGSGGGGNYVVALTPGDNPAAAYEVRNQAPYVPTPIALGDRLYLWSDQGIVTCCELATGDVIWRERVGGNYSGSPVIAGGKIYCIDMDGVVVVVAASDQFEVLGRNPLGELSRSTPAVANGHLYLRTESHLVSVGGL